MQMQIGKHIEGSVVDKAGGLFQADGNAGFGMALIVALAGMGLMVIVVLAAWGYWESK